MVPTPSNSVTTLFTPGKDYSKKIKLPMSFNAVLKDNGPSTPARYMRVGNRITMDDEPEHDFPTLADLVPPFTKDPRCACKNPAFDKALWFPPRGRSSGDRAKAICNRCPMKEPCAEYALQFSPNALHGIWGGLSETARLKIRAERRIAKCA